MEMNNDTFPPFCDPCLRNPFQLYTVLLILPTLFSIPVQILVLCTQVSSPLTEKTDVLSLCTICLDFLTSVFIVISVFTLNLLPVLYNYTWSVIVGQLSFGHPLFQSLVCLERYFAVEHPIVFLKYRPLRYRFAVLAVTWGITTVSNAVVMIICGLHLSFEIVFLKFECILLSTFLTVNSFGCLSILRNLLQASPGDKKLKLHNGSSRKLSVKRKAFCVILGVQINMLVCYLPPILFFWYNETVLCSMFLYNTWYIVITSGFHSLMYLHNANQLKKIYYGILRAFNINL